MAWDDLFWTTCNDECRHKAEICCVLVRGKNNDERLEQVALTSDIREGQSKNWADDPNDYAYGLLTTGNGC